MFPILMKLLMPQEVEVWYVLPAIRRELAIALVKNHSLSQKNVASILGVTEAAVSQYLKSKRGGEVEFSKEAIDKVKDSAAKIVKDPSNLRNEMYDLAKMVKVTKVLCDLHRKYDKDLPKECDICFETSK